MLKIFKDFAKNKIFILMNFYLHFVIIVFSMSDNDSNDDSQSDTTQKTTEDRIPLPPRIPLNYKINVPKNERLPVLDSAALFQSNTASTNDFELNPTLSLKVDPSSQLLLSSYKNDSSLFNNSGSIEHFNNVQIASKQQEFSPPNIKVEDYYLDLFKREINAPLISSKEEFLSVVEPYSIEIYAKHHFRKRSFLFFNKESTHQMTTFSDKPLFKPLLEKVPLSKKTAVEVLSFQILTFIGVIKERKSDVMNGQTSEERRDSILINIICTLRDDNTLIDEVLMQLIRLMRDSPSQEKLILAWKLFLITVSLFYITDQKISNVIRWFLINRVFNDDMEGKYAKFAFIRFHERNVLARNFDNMTKSEIINVPLGVSYGKRMFKTSLYMQMWNQQRKFPSLPIPLTLFLIVKALVKNGVFMTPRPFPFFEGKYSGRTKRDDESQANKPPDSPPNNNSLIENIEIGEKEEQYWSENEEKNGSNESENQNQNQNQGVANDDDVDDKAAAASGVSSPLAAAAALSGEEETALRYKNSRRKANFSIMKNWSSKLSSDYKVIDDGEVGDLFGLLMIWMLNLLDPIVPKSLSQSFIEVFSNSDSDENVTFSKYNDFVSGIPLLHLNTLKFLVGFLREVAANEKFTHENNRTIADDLSSYFVNTSFATIDPFTRQKMVDIAPRFLFFCLEKLDVSDVYPLNPVYAIGNEEQIL